MLPLRRLNNDLLPFGGGQQFNFMIGDGDDHCVGSLTIIGEFELLDTFNAVVFLEPEEQIHSTSSKVLQSALALTSEIIRSPSC